MKKITAVLMTAAMLFSLAACKKDSGNEPKSANYYGRMDAGGNNATTYAGGAQSSVGDRENADISYDEGDYESEVASAEFSDEILRKIIKNAYMHIESDAPSALYSDLSAYCYTLGGYEFKCEVYNYKEYSSVAAVLKIPPGKLKTFMDYVGQNGEVVNSEISSDDVSAAYYDAKTRLETKRVSLGSYYALLEKANSTSEIVYLQQVIDGITAEIEAYEGKIRMYDSLVDMATVELSISRERAETPTEPVSMWQTTKNGFMKTLNIVVSFFQWLFAIIIMLSPVWVIIAAVIAVTLAVKRGGKKKSAKQTEPAESFKEEDPVE